MNKRKLKNAREKRALCAFSFIAIAVVGILSLIGVGLSPVEYSGANLAFDGLGLGMAGLVVQNRGRLINFISGITGVASAGQALVNLPVNQRYHRIILNTTSGATVVDDVNDVIDSIKLIVNGVAVRDIAPADIIRLAQAQGYLPRLGELPILFTEPFGPNVNEPPDVTSWDLFGQSSFQLQIGLKTVTTPGITGIMEFDYMRNLRPTSQGPQPFLQPVAHHSFSQPIVTGRNDINTLPYNFPIRRLWLRGSTADNISQVEVYQDGNKVFEATKGQLRDAYRPYGFKFSQLDLIGFQNATGPADLAIDADLQPLAFFDVAFLSDPDSRYWKALKVGQNLILRVTSDSAQTLTTVMETFPGSFA
jgi:hypothetical protein